MQIDKHLSKKQTQKLSLKRHRGQNSSCSALKYKRSTNTHANNITRRMIFIELLMLETGWLEPVIIGGHAYRPAILATHSPFRDNYWVQVFITV